MSTPLTIFFITFIGSFLYWRLFLRVCPRYFGNPAMRSMLRVRWHHSHYGLLLSVGGLAVLFTAGLNQWSAGLLGLGTGFTLDEFILFLRLPTERSQELEIYRQTLKATIILFLAVIGTILLAFIYGS